MNKAGQSLCNSVVFARFGAILSATMSYYLLYFALLFSQKERLQIALGQNILSASSIFILLLSLYIGLFTKFIGASFSVTLAWLLFAISCIAVPNLIYPQSSHAGAPRIYYLDIFFMLTAAQGAFLMLVLFSVGAWALCIYFRHRKEAE